jgi:biopolymer transport protein ExbB
MLGKFNDISSAGGAVDAFWHYMTLGGPVVMWPIMGVAVVLAYALGVRSSLLKRGSGKNVRVLLKRAEEGRAKTPNGIVDEAIARGIALKRAGRPNLRRFLDEAFADLESDLRRHAVLISSAVAVAPLLGLLGTVIGMIETFESLADMTLFSQTGGIAAGIATALFTTQMGLVVAVPGVIAKGVLNRRQAQIELDLAQIKDILCSTPGAANTKEAQS